jgi:hypothetical protein
MLYEVSFMVQQPIVGRGLLIIEASQSRTDTPLLAGLLWTSDQPIAETSTWQHTTLTTDRRPCPSWDSNLQSQKASSFRPMPCTMHPLGLAWSESVNSLFWILQCFYIWTWVVRVCIINISSVMAFNSLLLFRYATRMHYFQCFFLHWSVTWGSSEVMLNHQIIVVCPWSLCAFYQHGTVLQLLWAERNWIKLLLLYNCCKVKLNYTF